MKDAFEGEESKGDLEMIHNLIMWIYQTQDLDKLEQMLQLAMTSNNELPSPEKVSGQIEDDKTTKDTTADTSVTTPAVGGS